MPETRRYSPANPMGLSPDAAGAQQWLRAPTPPGPPRPNGNPNANNAPDGPGPCGVSKNDEFCIKNDEFCTKNEELCIKNEEFCIKTVSLQVRNLGHLKPAGGAIFY